LIAGDGGNLLVFYHTEIIDDCKGSYTEKQKLQAVSPGCGDRFEHAEGVCGSFETLRFRWKHPASEIYSVI
jgi:hypothetical protein